jgi:two-component system sensor histidine kinase UhpB
MTGNALILHVEPGTDSAHEVAERLSPYLSHVLHRSVSDATSLAAVLGEQPWDAVLCEPYHAGVNLPHAQMDHTPYAFLDSMPGMACQIYLDKQGVLHFPYVSEGCFDLLGITASVLEQQSLMNYLHPDDADDFLQSMQLSAKLLTPWNWEGRIILRPKGEIKWVNLRAKHHKSNTEGLLWQGFMVNITQNKLSEIEIIHSRQRLRELSAHIESIKEEERTRIAREIHDEIGVLLTALKMDLAWVAQRLPGENSALLEKTQGMAALLDTAGRAANNLVHSLRPGSLDCFGLVATIEIEAHEFTKRTGTPCKVIKSSEHLDISKEQSITLFRVFQETLNNIMKHATASHVRVQILKEDAVCADNCIELIVSDDGCGFDDSARNKPRSFGLRGIQERIGQLGGKVKISSKPGKGTKIAVRLPLTSGQ